MSYPNPTHPYPAYHGSHAWQPPTAPAETSYPVNAYPSQDLGNPQNQNQPTTYPGPDSYRQPPTHSYSGQPQYDQHNPAAHSYHPVPSPYSAQYTSTPNGHPHFAPQNYQPSTPHLVDQGALPYHVGYPTHLGPAPVYSPSPIPSPNPNPAAYPYAQAYSASPAPPSTSTSTAPLPPVELAEQASVEGISTTVAPGSLKIKLNVPKTSAPLTSTPPANMSRRAAPGHPSLSARPVRSARTQPVSYKDDGDDDFEDEASEDPEEEEEEEEEEPVSTRSRRVVIKPDRFAESDIYDQKPRRASLEKRDGSRRTSRSHPEAEYAEETPEKPQTRRAFPTRQAVSQTNPASLDNLFDDNGDDSGPPPPMESQETVTPTRRKGGRRGRSRQSSEGSFNPDESDDQSEQTESDDPIANDHIHGDDDEDEDDDEDYGYGDSRRPRRKAARAPARRVTRTSARTKMGTRTRGRAAEDDEDDAPYGKRLRERKSTVNYALPPADLSAEILQEAIASASRPNGRAGVGRAGGVRFAGATGGKGLPWSARGRDLAQAMGDPDTSDSDDLMPPMKGGAGPSAVPAGGAGRGGPTDVPNFGRINPKSSTADADPLGVDMNVSFDNVGGLDGHINQLKEMVALPLLYPELFQQFGITPPRGVLFHGPPGTGKTLLARALAASCSTGNTKIAFFMRKGADVLSKWVGEAERQLRMLFEEARAAQPSIIFFDEIDGLAPVRSSKQDQIHASLVSTLLALMDGMDGRGQVIVIGATNRPDAVDPALRRPGRFDREFYFPLPNKEARKKIIGINTRNWDPKLSDPVLDQLAGLTKGYGGADLRALCTEAALNAIQRRYPQIYKTSDRLLLQPNSIQVQAKDFMMSVKKIVPSSARSTASAAAPLPAHLLPLMSTSLAKLKSVVDNALPSKRNATALEEAEFEEDEGDSFAKHSMLQSLDKMRTYRPRILVHGASGMGQAWLGPAILHHLEGFHVQTLDLGTLMGDSSRTVEAALVQLFVEAKRHQPSVIFIPSLSQWASAISDTVRSTIRALLDGVPSSDPILVLALVDGALRDLPSEIKAWFGLGQDNRVKLDPPTSAQRESYFTELVQTISMPPTEFPDALPRRKRVLEILPPAPPLPPREKTEAEIAKEHEKDVQAREMMIISFTGLVQDFMRKFRKVTATVREDAIELSAVLQAEADLAVANGIAAERNGEIVITPVVNVNGDGSHVSPYTESALPIPPMSQETSQLSSLPTETVDAPPPAVAVPTAAIEPAPEAESGASDVAVAVAPVVAASTPVWQAHNLDIDIISLKLSKHKYLTPSDFLADIAKIEENADKLGDPDRITRIGEMGAHARMHVMGFDPAWGPRFDAYAQRVKERKAKRQREKEDKKRGAESDAEAVDAGTAETLPNGAVEATSLKRPREDGEETGREDKRMREGEDVVMADTSASMVPASTEPSSAMDLPTTAPSQLSQPEPGASTSTTVPPPKVVHPPFVVPGETLAALRRTLINATSAFTVEQLEQLRATCFDKIWRHRADWDRTACVQEVQRAVDGLVVEVDEMREEED